MYAYELEIDELGGRLFATVLIDYNAHPSEAMVRYYPDGSGYPGSPASIEDVIVTVTSLSGANWDKTREELGDWASIADEIAQAHIEAELDRGLADDLFENAYGD